MSSKNEIATGFIEPDDVEESGYETTGSGVANSDTTSLASSLQEWLIENGRRYHAYYGPDKNLMPTDEVEQERLDIHHEVMLLITNGQLYKAPIGNASKVLDIGTGTGIWVIDYATEHPEAEVIGLDLSPIQPNWVPPNCRFEVDDFELEWTYDKNSFDFIHGRNICHSVKQWSVVLAEIMSHLKPGGWFEIAELDASACSDDDSIPKNWAPKRAMDLIRESLSVLGRVAPTAEWLETLLKDAGFVDVEVKTFKQPMTPWPKQKDLKQAGALITLMSETAYHAYLMSLLTRALGWTSEDADAFCKEADATHQDRKSRAVHAYVPFYIAYGRKPTE